jgi:hypothetical protein
MSTQTSAESLEYRVVLGQSGQFDLFELESQTPLVVTATPDAYESRSLKETVASLRPGNRITAFLNDTGETRDTGLFESPVYRFREVSVVNRTRAYHGFGDIPVISHAERIVTQLTKNTKGIGRATITDGQESIGRVVVFNRDYPSPAEPVFESELASLSASATPPFYVFQTATEDGRFLVHYYLTTDDCDLYRLFKDHIEAGTDEWRETKPPAEFRDSS